MKTLLTKNSAYLALSCVILLIVCSVSYSFYCKNVMARSLRLEALSSYIVANTYSIVSDRLQAVDNCVRSYGLTKSNQDLSYLAEGYNGLGAHITRIYIKLEEQKSALPDYRVEIDSLEDMLNRTHEKISQYYESTEFMIKLARQDSLTAFKKILAEQRGMIPWAEWYALDNKTNSIQEKLRQKAQTDYEAAVLTNSFIQLFLSLLSLPTLIWIIIKLFQQERKRTSLLIELDQNNRKYLFDDGTMLDDVDAKTQLKAANLNIKKAVGFINKIARGIYDVEWSGLTEENKNKNQETLAGELLRMRDEMVKQKKESDQRNWTNEGFTFLGEIIRKHNNLQQITDSFLSAVVNYVKANQGALFIVTNNESESFLELTSTFAYSKKRYLDKKILPGEGMIGQAWLEKETLLLTEIPTNYIKITSGMGEALPKSLLIVPIKSDDQLQGVLELASFELFKEFEIKFIEKIAENLAVVLYSIRMNERTKKLLDQSQQQAENLRLQEEEMRQNMEELEAAQEEMSRKEFQYIKKIEEMSTAHH